MFSRDIYVQRKQRDNPRRNSPEPLDVTHFVTAGVLPQVIHHGDVHRYGHILRFDGDEVSKGHLSNKQSMLNNFNNCIITITPTPTGFSYKEKT